MDALTFAFVVAAVSSVALLWPVASTWRGASPARALVVLLLQTAPLAASLAYFDQLHRQALSPFFRSHAPEPMVVVFLAAGVQLFATSVALRGVPLRRASKAWLVAISVVAAFLATFIGAGIVACSHGNCL